MYSSDYINTVYFNEEDLFYPPVCECGCTMIGVALGKDIELNRYVELFSCPECMDNKTVYL